MSLVVSTSQGGPNSSVPDQTAIADDVVGGVVYPITKLDGGGAGASVPIVAGQQVAAGSLPVVLTAAQQAALTPPAAITGFALESGGHLASIDTGVAALPTASDFDSKIGSLTETAPATDTASSGLNGRLQRIAQRLTSLIAIFTNGAGTAAAAVRTTLASDDPAVATLGATSGAAVVTDANGTIQGYLRGLVKLWIGGLAAGANLIGKVGIDQTTSGTTNLVSTISGQNGVAGGSGVTGATVQRVVLATDVALPAGTNSIGGVTAPTLTKGTQGANGWSTQDLKDAGRSTIIFNFSQAPGQAAELLLTMAWSVNGAAQSTGTTYTPTSGKRLRIQSFTAFESTPAGNTTSAAARVSLRINTAGAATASSPIQESIIAMGTAVATAYGNVAGGQLTLTDGHEILGDGTLTIGVSVTIPGWVTTVANPTINVCIIAYEY